MPQSNVVINNNVSDNHDGLYLAQSYNGTFINNSLTNNTYNLAVRGSGLYDDYLYDYNQSIDTSNTVNGKPIYYLFKHSDDVIDSATNAGCVYVINSTNITVRDLNLKNNYYGILFENVRNSKAVNLTLNDNYKGIYLD